jgi:predicted oxidoreductase
MKECGMVKSVPVGGGGLLLSRLALGLWRSLKQAGGEEALAGLIEHSVALGIHTFDHADIYGGYEAQALFGRAIARCSLRREQLTLVSKCGVCLVNPQRPSNHVKHYDASAAHITASVEQTLRDLRTDHLDLLLLHRPDVLMNPAEVAAAFRALRREGKVLHFGVSNHSPAQLSLLQTFVDEPLVAQQVQLSLAHAAPLWDGTLDQCLQFGITPMAWSPLGGGGLSKSAGLQAALTAVAEEVGAQTAEQVALAWLLMHPAGILPVLGTSQPLYLSRAAAASTLVLNRQQWYRLLEAATGQPVA